MSILNLIRSAMGRTISGNGVFTKKCHAFFEKRFKLTKVLLTTSCTDALEMSAILCNIEPGDEVIMPSFTFMSTPNAFLLRGAKIVFADTLADIPNIDPAEIERLITKKTKAVVVVHYCGIACDMDAINEICKKNHLFLIEDAAHAIEATYKGRPLGSIGNFGTFSFHETKNIICGEGGLLIINDQSMSKRAEIIWEKGTNRAAFFRGEVDKYGWVDIGSSFLPSDAIGAMLFYQLTHFDQIQNRRKKIWHTYHQFLAPLEEQHLIKRPVIPSYATVNGNMYYVTVASSEERDSLINYLRKYGINAVFHYLPLHSSQYFKEKHDGRNLPNTQHFSDCIVRLPFYYKLKNSQIRFIVNKIQEFYTSRSAG